MPKVATPISCPSWVTVAGGPPAPAASSWRTEDRAPVSTGPHPRAAPGVQGHGEQEVRVDAHGHGDPHHPEARPGQAQHPGRDERGLSALAGRDPYARNTANRTAEAAGDARTRAGQSRSWPSTSGTVNSASQPGYTRRCPRRSPRRAPVIGGIAYGTAQPAMVSCNDAPSGGEFGPAAGRRHREATAIGRSRLSALGTSGAVRGRVARRENTNPAPCGDGIR